jgi:hypothetical protein
MFWADEAGRSATPSGHWMSILNQVLVVEDASLAIAAESYAKVGIAAADSFITSWYTKYLYNLIRPVSYIQATMDAAWNIPAFAEDGGTPPFPEYTSEHSVQSSAAAQVLTNLFGVEYAFTDHTHERAGLPARSYSSFIMAANEAGISRLYAGIHYRAAIEAGFAQGECVAERVLQLTFDSR